MGEQHHPVVIGEIVKIDRTQLGILGEIGNGIAELKGHGLRGKDI